MKRCTTDAENAKKSCTVRNTKKEKNAFKDAHLKYQDAALKRQKIIV